MTQKDITDSAAAYKKDAEDHFNEAVAALLLLAWKRRREDFSFRDEDFYDEALAICITMTDKCAESARRWLEEITDEQEAWDAVYDDDIQARFDMAGSHLLELLEVWISVSVVNNWSLEQTRVMITRYRANPYASPAWSGLPRVLLRWGRGYDKDVAKQIKKIGQDTIISGARYAQWMDEAAKGATYYIRRRGSTYDCPVCDSLCGYPIPMTEPFDFPHSRCMCYPEYHYEPLTF